MGFSRFFTGPDSGVNTYIKLTSVGKPAVMTMLLSALGPNACGDVAVNFEHLSRCADNTLALSFKDCSSHGGLDVSATKLLRSRGVSQPSSSAAPVNALEATQEVLHASIVPPPDPIVQDPSGQQGSFVA
jgi:hypothetical protein